MALYNPVHYELETSGFKEATTRAFLIAVHSVHTVEPHIPNAV